MKIYGAFVTRTVQNNKVVTDLHGETLEGPVTRHLWRDDQVLDLTVEGLILPGDTVEADSGQVYTIETVK